MPKAVWNENVAEQARKWCRNLWLVLHNEELDKASRALKIPFGAPPLVQLAITAHYLFTASDTLSILLGEIIKAKRYDVPFMGRYVAPVRLCLADIATYLPKLIDYAQQSLDRYTLPMDEEE